MKQLPMTSPLVRAELARLSAAMPKIPDTLRGLLEYLIRMAREGTVPSTAEIARDVFRRDANHDPERDPIVRIQVGRLRRLLDERYQSTDGQVRIFIEKDSLVLNASCFDA